MGQGDITPRGFVSNSPWDSPKLMISGVCGQFALKK